MARRTQVINGAEYVYEYDSTWVRDKKYGTHNRNYIGKMVDSQFVPNKKYRLQMELEESKKRGPVPVTVCKRLFYGATYLFDAIGAKLGVSADLKKMLPRNPSKDPICSLLPDSRRSQSFKPLCEMGPHPRASLRQRNLFAALQRAVLFH